jgi:two-component system alkaline phosphatase synthesis response regulator PhoP
LVLKIVEQVTEYQLNFQNIVNNSNIPYGIAPYLCKKNIMNILLVEDEQSLHDVIKLNLELEGHKVLSAFDGKKAIEIHQNSKCDLIILDIMMPHINGFDVCQTIRLEDQKTPIIFLSARDQTEDKIKGLEIGADDFLGKPFHMKELLLRIKNLIKRSDNNNDENHSEYSIGEFDINLKSYEITKEGILVEKLSEKQARLLKLLLDNENNVVSRKEILQKVWQYDTIPNTRTIDNVILSFRKIFESENTSYFQSVRGVGYKFSKKNTP